MSTENVEARKQRVALERIADAVEEIAAGFRAPKVTLDPSANRAPLGQVQLTTPAGRVARRPQSDPDFSPGHRTASQRFDEEFGMTEAEAHRVARENYDDSIPEPMGEDG